MGSMISSNSPGQQGLHIGRDGVINGSVSVSNVNNYSLPCTESALLKSGPFCYNYPDFPQKRFVGHSELLRQLKEWFNEEPGDEDNFLSFHTMVVCGMGGAGKTTLVHRFIQANAGSCEKDFSVIWLPAETENILDTHFRTLATMLGCNTGQANRQDLNLILQQVYSSIHDQKTLLVFDNAVTSISNVNTKPMVSKYLPKVIRHSNLKIIITSRNQDWQDVTSNVCRMETLHPSDAKQYIEHSLNELPDVKAHSKDVADFFDNLPIAIESAVDAILYRNKREQALGNEYSLKKFLQVLAKHGKQQTDSNCEEITRTYIRLDTLWNQTLDMLAKDSKNGKLAIKILNYLAFLSPDGVPVALITKLFEGQKFSRGDLEEAILLLQTLSLVTTHKMAGGIKMHRLLRSSRIKELKNERTLTTLYIKFLQVYQNTLVLLTFKDSLNYVSYSGNARTVCDNFMTHVMNSENNSLKKAGLAYVIEILHKLSIFHPEYVSEVSNDILDLTVDVYPNTTKCLIRIRNQAYEKSGKYQKALESYKATLAVESSTFGHSHLITSATKYRLASVLERMGQYDDALIIYQDTLKVLSGILGSNHPDTLTTKQSMALVLIRMGKYEDALETYVEVFKVRSDIQGINHPDTLSVKYNIALVLERMGQYDDALKAYDDLLKVLPGILGSNHPDTLDTKQSMALVLNRMGNYMNALKAYDEVLKVRSDIQGINHPDTLRAKHNIASTLERIGQYEDALKACDEVLKVQCDILGSNHPDTLATKHSMASVLNKIGKHEDALKIFHEVLKVRSDILGSNHPTTLTTKHNMALVLIDMGKYEDALKAYEEVLKVRSGTLGSNHPNTLSAKYNMASVLNDMGKYEDALKAYDEVLKVQCDILGSNHPDTLATKRNMATVLDNMGGDAQKACNEVLNVSSI